MRLFYLYNEILPTGRAHDVYLFRNCLSLAQEGIDLSLVIGKGSKGDEALLDHYNGLPTDHFELRRLPIVRKNNFLNISWNRPFFQACQRLIAKERPDLVLLSVRKQGQFHLQRKIPGVKYVYEVHELLWWPENQLLASKKEIEEERLMLSRADLVVVTTASLERILRSPPYALPGPIALVPLASSVDPLSEPVRDLQCGLQCGYVGQLYPQQGVELLLEALKSTPHAQLKIVGGKKEDVLRLKTEAERLGIQKQVQFYGFQPPKQFGEILQDVDLFLMPSANLTIKPHVAHTKLRDYVHFGRPLVAPACVAVQEQLPDESSILFYEVGSASSLAMILNQLSDPHVLLPLQQKARRAAGQFTWKRRALSYAPLLSQLL
jgi:glycosyltransferase involved in cell wall biosynthesis